MTIGAAWRGVRDLFRRAGIETPELDARLLAEVAFGLDRLELVNREREPAPADALAKMQLMAERRLRGEPVTRILGEREFFGLTFKLNEATLVPRPETEMLVVRTLQLLEGRARKRILDLGTGSGCIAVSVLTESPSATAIGVDLANDAILAAEGNAERHGVAKRFEARKGSWFDALQAGETFDVIVSNPPYIESATIGTLKPEVKDHDPHLALDGGPDGLDAYRAIIAQAPVWLKPDGWVVVEVGADQGHLVKALFTKAGLVEVAIEKDLAGLDRMVVGHHS
ncbi:MAG: peptide chain release factor N(5)-glutamine methyltransferase [Methyloceanibacter sp.]